MFDLNSEKIFLSVQQSGVQPPERLVFLSMIDTPLKPLKHHSTWSLTSQLLVSRDQTPFAT